MIRFVTAHDTAVMYWTPKAQTLVVVSGSAQAYIDQRDALMDRLVGRRVLFPVAVSLLVLGLALLGFGTIGPLVSDALAAQVQSATSPVSLLLILGGLFLLASMLLGAVVGWREMALCALDSMAGAMVLSLDFPLPYADDDERMVEEVLREGTSALTPQVRDRLILTRVGDGHFGVAVDAVDQLLMEGFSRWFAEHREQEPVRKSRAQAVREVLGRDEDSL